MTAPKQPRPLTPGAYVDAMARLSDAEALAFTGAQEAVEARFEQKRIALLDRVPQPQRAIAERMLAAAIEKE